MADPVVTFGTATGEGFGGPNVTFGVATGEPLLALAKINGFFIDCLLSDNHTFDAEVTEFPVESGATISDNIRNKPLVVVMDCLVSNTPIGQLASLRNGGPEGGGGAPPADTAYEMLQKVRTDRQPVTILTSLRTYDNMALQSLTIPRESGRGDELRFTVSFKQIELVVNKREKRVAIVGAKTGGAATKAANIVRTNGTKYVYLNTRTKHWYDFVIDDWRDFAKFVTKPAAPTIHTTGPATPPTPVEVDRWVLGRGKPEAYTAAEWNRRPASQRTDSVVRADLIFKNGGNVRNITYTEQTMRDITLLAPSEYQFEHPVNVSIGELGPVGAAEGVQPIGPDSPGTD